jgi:DnaJ-domain-containing protein 1
MIVRLAVAVMAADGRITPNELAAADQLDRIGLGPLAGLAREEIERAVAEPIDLAATCAALSEVSSEGGRIILAVLAGIATADRVVSPGEQQVIRQIAAHLGLPREAADEALALSAGATARPPTTGQPEAPDDESPPPRLDVESPAGPALSPAVSRSVANAFALLGLRPGASGADVETAYRAAVERYDPKKVIDLGPEFAVLAVRKLAEATAAFEVALDAARRSAA